MSDESIDSEQRFILQNRKKAQGPLLVTFLLLVTLLNPYSVGLFEDLLERGDQTSGEYIFPPHCNYSFDNNIESMKKWDYSQSRLNRTEYWEIESKYNESELLEELSNISFSYLSFKWIDGENHYYNLKTYANQTLIYHQLSQLYCNQKISYFDSLPISISSH